MITRRLYGWAQVRQLLMTDECSTDWYTALLEKHMPLVSPSRMEELIKIFIRATELEIRFWDMGLEENSR